MSNLISRKVVMDWLRDLQARAIINNHDGTLVDATIVATANNFIDFVVQIPTAYDVDKVVEHLTKRFDFCQEMAEKNDKAKLEKMAFSWRQVANGVMDAIDIVKGAVKDE